MIRNFATQRAQEIASEILRILADGPATSATLIEKTGVDRTTVQAIIRKLRDDKRLHIGAWERLQGKRANPMYALGDLSDKVKPKPLPQKVVQRRYWQRMKRNCTEQYVRKLQKLRLQRFKPRPDIASSWITATQSEETVA